MAAIKVLKVDRPMTLKALINKLMSRPEDCDKVPQRMLAARSVRVNGIPQTEGAENAVINAERPQMLELGTLMWAIKMEGN